MSISRLHQLFWDCSPVLSLTAFETSPPDFCQMVVLSCSIDTGVILNPWDGVCNGVVYAFNIDNMGPYSSSNNLHWYTRSKVMPRASIMRLTWSVYIFMDWPHSIPLNSFKVSTMASSSIMVTLYLRCVEESFWLKNGIGLFSWVITAPSCLLKASVEISKTWE